MMDTVNLTQIREDLESPQIQKQIPALETATAIINFLAIKAVEALEKSENRFLVAERLANLGSVVIPYLEKLLIKTEDAEIQILAALVLVKFNSKFGIPILLDAVANSEDYAGIAAEYLAKNGVREAIAIILKRLKSCDLKQVDLVVSLLDALKKLEGELPLELYDRFTGSDVPWQIKSLCVSTEHKDPKILEFGNKL